MFTSYAQNFEDVILWRALKHVENGFYIDIGAQDPVEDSVSLSFYEQGWRGVHVEPTSHYAAKLRAARADEEVIEAAIGAGTGILTFNEFSGTGLSTGDSAIAKQHAEAGLEMKEIPVPVVALQHLLDRHADREVHWLKIDVEGMESTVIESWGSSPVRPWIVVVESTLPRSNEKSHQKWDPHLKGLGYEFVYFDGLNRFYVSEEHSELKVSFGPGPNFFDEFVFPASSTSHMLAPMRQQLSMRDAKIDLLHQHIADADIANTEQLTLKETTIHERDIEIERLRRRIADAGIANTRQLADKEAAIQERDAEIARLSESITTLIEQVEQLAALTDAFRSSTSWKLTAPFRGLKVTASLLAQSPRAFANWLIPHARLWIRRRPLAKRILVRSLRAVPPLHHAISKAVSEAQLAISPDDFDHRTARISTLTTLSLNNESQRIQRHYSLLQSLLIRNKTRKG
ncbi:MULTISPECIES: FkbM family methyltransferase [unclassified Mesorhizobium]|uniref:FkbM family methyltransferase n=1 Tax=unclassified Mesorhizobium TaxID=325217 RepID=UPI000F75C82D|nr:MULTISPECIES: FkbM family methyltransferase [unclassified Mesorhizobium]AZO31545.1 FkbM family methyltransferase [Mesorhizobium sp. M1B.F.Ca.ET.045.04.1.1]RWB22899.1 MAG: FkbM family methyltransferase [Mesorhizobium sp.]